MAQGGPKIAVGNCFRGAQKGPPGGIPGANSLRKHSGKGFRVQFREGKQMECPFGRARD